jgi:hypothetical protein
LFLTGGSRASLVMRNGGGLQCPNEKWDKISQNYHKIYLVATGKGKFATFLSHFK